MTICSWRTQSPERPLNFVRPHAKLRKSKARCTTTSVLRNRHSGLCQSLEFERSILRNDICSIAPIHPPHASLSWAVLRAHDSFFRDYGWSADVRAAPRPLVAVPTHLQKSSCIVHNYIRRGRFIFSPKGCSAQLA
jgi:hypothetical protein